MSLLSVFDKLKDIHFVLASASPRREEIIRKMGVQNVRIVPSDAEENLDKGLGPEAYSKATCRLKGDHVWQLMQCNNALWHFLISADTIVTDGEHILEKPANEAAAVEMLMSLSGRSHYVITSLAIYNRQSPTPVLEFTSSTTVVMKPYSIEEAKEYVKTNEPFDKAGGYGIQGLGGHLVSRIEGDYYNVMGFPYHQLSNELATLIKNKQY